jgi:precorrin-2 dehydrogenase/sirohydrochlorin ferrochelatase
LGKRTISGWKLADKIAKTAGPDADKAGLVFFTKLSKLYLKRRWRILMPKYYPIFIDIEGAQVLVVGGGTVAFRKIETLLDHGARVNVVTKKLHPGLEALVSKDRIRLLGSKFEPSHLDGMRLVIAATDDKETNREVSAAARERELPVNAVDQPPDCTFIVPAVVRRGALTIAVSTSGNSPALASKIRRRLEGEFGREYETYIALLGSIRTHLLQLQATPEENSRIFHELVEGGLLEAIRRDDRENVKTELRRVLPAGVDIEPLCAKVLGSAD